MTKIWTTDKGKGKFRLVPKKKSKDTGKKTRTLA